MKYYLFLGIFVCLLTACQKENITPISENTNIKSRRTGVNTLSPVITTGPNHVYTTLNESALCSNHNITSLPSVANTSSWTAVNSTTPGRIDYELDQVFHCANYFSMCNIKPGLNLAHTHVVTFEFADGGYLNYDPVLGFVQQYNYLSSSIDIPTAEILKQHFACEIQAYAETYCPNYYIYDVDFYGGATLGHAPYPPMQTHYLLAEVTFQLHDISTSYKNN